MGTPTWWKSIRESLKPKGLIYICPEGHSLLVEHADVARWVTEGVETLPDTCPGCGGPGPQGE